MFVSIITGLWVVAVVTQLYYWLMVVWPLAGHRSLIRPGKAPVSVVICTNDATPQLSRLLRDILAQDYHSIELVLVNDGPIPEVAGIVAEIGTDKIKLVDFHTDTKATSGKKEVLQAGILAASHDWLLLTDADCSVQPGWVSSMISLASAKSKMVLGYAPLKRTGGLASYLAVFDNIMIGMQYLGMARKQKAYMGVGRNILYHRSLFQSTRGFSEHLDIASGDDDLFIQQAAPSTKVAINLDQQSFVYSPTMSDLRSLIQQKRRHVSTATKYRPRDQWLIGLFGLSFIGFWLLAAAIIAVWSPVLILILMIGILAQWLVVFQLSRKLNNRKFAIAYVPFAPIYAIFMIYLGTVAIFSKPPKQWK